MSEPAEHLAGCSGWYYRHGTEVQGVWECPRRARCVHWTPDLRDRPFDTLCHNANLERFYALLPVRE